MQAFLKVADWCSTGIRPFFLFMLFFLLLAWVLIVDPLVPKMFCTLSGVLGTGIEVRFSKNKMPKSYEIVVNSPKETQKIKCPNGGDTNQYASKCTGNGAFIAAGFNSRPEDYTVTVRANGKTFTQKIDPGSCQDASNVNGKGCPPFCYRASATINLAP